MVPFGTIGTVKTEKKERGAGESKGKEERKGEKENRAIDRSVRRFEIRTKPSTRLNNRFGISLNLLESLLKP